MQKFLQKISSKLTAVKFLLLAVGIMCSQGVWGQSTVVYGRAMAGDTANGYSAWSSADVATSGNNVWVGQFVYNETYGLYASATGNRSSVMTFAHTANSLQTFDIVFNNLGNTGNAGNYSYIKIGSDIEIQSNQQNQTGTVIINGNSSSITDCNQKNYNRGGDSWTIHVEINTAQNKVTSLTIVGTEKTYGNNTKHAHYTLASATALSNAATYNTVTIGFTRAGGTPSAALTSIKITEEAQEVTNTDYTINYKFEGTTIKTDEGTSSVGATINAIFPFTVDGQKYYAADGATTSMELVDGTNILNVDVRKANEYAYSVSNNFGTSIASGTYVEGEPAINVYWSKYVENGGTWYECDESTYGVSVSGTLTKTVSYTTVSNISYFIECENMTVSRSAAATDTGTGWSGGKAPRHYKSSYWYTNALSGGVYNLSIPYKNANSTDGTIYLYLRDASGNLSDTGLSVVGNKQSTGTLTAEGIGVPPGYSLVLNNSTEYNSNVLMDYVALTKTAEYTLSVPVTAAGYATFSSAYALDLANIDGGKAYIAQVLENGGTITMTEWKSAVPANTGLLIKANTAPAAGETATVTIPVAADGTAPTTNYLIATDGNDVAAGNYVFAYMTSDYSGVGFYKLDNATHIDAGKAYLDGTAVTSAGGAIKFRFDEDTATAISTVAEDAAKFDGATYNLAGQRVDASYKGIVIRNGKKFLVK